MTGWLLVVIGLLELLILLAIAGLLTAKRHTPASVTPLKRPRVVRGTKGHRVSAEDTQVAGFVAQTGYAVHVVQGQFVAMSFEGHC